MGLFSSRFASPTIPTPPVPERGYAELPSHRTGRAQVQKEPELTDQELVEALAEITSQALAAERKNFKSFLFLHMYEASRRGMWAIRVQPTATNVAVMYIGNDGCEVEPTGGNQQPFPFERRMDPSEVGTLARELFPTLDFKYCAMGGPRRPFELSWKHVPNIVVAEVVADKAIEVA